MGEAKRKAAERLVDDGLLIEAGWQILRGMAVDKGTSPIHLEAMRMAFFAGALHLFGSVLSFIDPQEELTQVDMKRLDALRAELDRFTKKLEQRVARDQGKA